MVPGHDRGGGDLSPREFQLLSLAAQGFTDQGISNKLSISLGTIGTYWGRIRIKYGPLNRTELVAIWLKEQGEAAIEQLRRDNHLLLDEIKKHVLNEELLQATLDSLQHLIHSPPDAIFIVDSDGRILLVNSQAEAMFGYEQGSLEGMLIENLVPSNIRDAHTTNRSEYIQNPVRRPMGDHAGIEGQRKDGSLFPITAILSPRDNPSGMIVTCIVREMAPILEAAFSKSVDQEY